MCRRGRRKGWTRPSAFPASPPVSVSNPRFRTDVEEELSGEVRVDPLRGGRTKEDRRTLSGPDPPTTKGKESLSNPPFRKGIGSLSEPRTHETETDGVGHLSLYRRGVFVYQCCILDGPREPDRASGSSSDRKSISLFFISRF